jgi:hypothetical protein
MSGTCSAGFARRLPIFNRTLFSPDCRPIDIGMATLYVQRNGILLNED